MNLTELQRERIKRDLIRAGAIPKNKNLLIEDSISASLKFKLWILRRLIK